MTFRATDLMLDALAVGGIGLSTCATPSDECFCVITCDNTNADLSRGRQGSPRLASLQAQLDGLLDLQLA